MVWAYGCRTCAEEGECLKIAAETDRIYRDLPGPAVIARNLLAVRTAGPTEHLACDRRVPGLTPCCYRACAVMCCDDGGAGDRRGSRLLWRQVLRWTPRPLRATLLCGTRGCVSHGLACAHVLSNTWLTVRCVHHQVDKAKRMDDFGDDEYPGMVRRRTVVAFVLFALCRSLTSRCPAPALPGGPRTALHRTRASVNVGDAAARQCVVPEAVSHGCSTRSPRRGDQRHLGTRKLVCCARPALHRTPS